MHGENKKGKKEEEWKRNTLKLQEKKHGDVGL